MNPIATRISMIAPRALSSFPSHESTICRAVAGRAVLWTDFSPFYLFLHTIFLLFTHKRSVFSFQTNSTYKNFSRWALTGSYVKRSKSKIFSYRFLYAEFYCSLNRFLCKGFQTAIIDASENIQRWKTNKDKQHDSPSTPSHTRKRLLLWLHMRRQKQKWQQVLIILVLFIYLVSFQNCKIGCTDAEGTCSSRREHCYDNQAK